MLLSSELESTLKKVVDFIKNSDVLSQDQVESVKTLFQSLLEKGGKYDVDDVEKYLETHNVKNKNIIIRITNLSHYLQTKYEQTSKIRFVPNDSSDC